MVFEDKTKVPSMMDGEPVQVSEFVHTFRKRLLSEHLGLSEDEVKDPCSEEFTDILNDRAEVRLQFF